MIRRFYWIPALVVAAALIWLLHVQERIAKEPYVLKEGVYRLKWQPLGTKGLAAGAKYVPLEKKPNKVNGLKSSDNYWGTSPYFTIILDESEGTGTGYDTAYLIPARYAKNIIDLKHAVQLDLTERNSIQLVSEESGPFKIATDKQKAVHTSTLSISIDSTRDSEGAYRPYGAMPTIGSGWVGKIKSDHGYLNVISNDADDDGLYGSKLKRTTDRMDREGDSVWIGKHYYGCDCSNCRLVHFAKACGYSGKFYSMEMSESGDTLSIKPYTGPMGTIRLNVVDGKNRTAKSSSPYFSGTDGCFNIDANHDMKIPTGEYAYRGVFVPPIEKDSDINRFGVILYGPKEQNIKVTEGKRTVVKIGGPIKMTIEPKEKALSANRGAKDFSLAFSTVSDDLHVSFRGERSVKIEIRDPSGKIVKEGKAEFG